MDTGLPGHPHPLIPSHRGRGKWDGEGVITAINKPIVVKIGGSTLGQHDTTVEDLVELQKRGQQVVVVHGGGKLITEWLNKLGAPTQFVKGERVTDKPGLEIVTAVLAGVVNKELVASINTLGGKATGVSGVDGPMIKGKIKDAALGYVGVVIEVDKSLLQTLLTSSYLPVISSVCLNAFERPKDAPLLLNVNADTAAGEIAAAIGAEKLIFLTDVPGIADKSGKVINDLTAGEAGVLTASGVASGGMIPKIKAGIRALSAGAIVRIIDGRQPHALLREIEGQKSGTTIHA